MTVTRFLVAALIALVPFAGSARAVEQTASDQSETMSRPASVRDPSAWRTVALDRALASATAIQDPYRRAQSLASIARAQALLPDSPVDRTVHHALAAAHEVSSAEFRAWVLHDIVLAQIAAEDLHGARVTADSIAARRQQGAALAAIGDFQLRSGDLPAVVRIARKIREPAIRGELLRRVVAIHASTGDSSQAQETLRQIDDPLERALAMGDMAAAEVREGNPQAALALGARTRRKHRAQVYARIAIAQADAGDLHNATQSLRHIDDPLQRALVQGGIAAVRATNGDPEAAQKVFAAAFSTLDALPDRTPRSVMLRAQLARMQDASGDSTSAGAQLMRAAQEIQQLPPGTAREEALDHIGRSQARMGHADAALTSALQMKDQIARALLVRDVVTLESGTSSASAAATAARFDDPLVEIAALFGVLGVQLVTRELAGARETIEAAWQSVRAMDQKLFKPAAFAALAAASVRIGEPQTGERVFSEALASAADLRTSELCAHAYTSIVTALNERLMFLGQPVTGSAEEGRGRGLP